VRHSLFGTSSIVCRQLEHCQVLLDVRVLPAKGRKAKQAHRLNVTAKEEARTGRTL